MKNRSRQMTRPGHEATESTSDMVKVESAIPIRVKILLVLLLCLPFAGCYQADQEVIPANVAETLPYKPDKVDLQEDGGMVLHQPASGHDYAFTQTKKDGSNVQKGTLRVMRVKGSIYAVQLKYEDENSYDVLFCQIGANKFEIMEPKSDDAVLKLADRYKVHIKNGNNLSGEPGSLLDFIKAHKELIFQPFKG